MQLGGGNTIAPFRTSYLPYKPSISVFTCRHMTISYAAAANLSVVDLWCSETITAIFGYICQSPFYVEFQLECHMLKERSYSYKFWLEIEVYPVFIAERISARLLFRFVFSRYAYVRVGHA